MELGNLAWHVTQFSGPVLRRESEVLRSFFCQAPIFIFVENHSYIFKHHGVPTGMMMMIQRMTWVDIHMIADKRLLGFDVLSVN